MNNRADEFAVLVCGGRTYSDFNQLTRQLDRLHDQCPITLIIHGATAGADSLAGRYAALRGIPCHPYPPNRQKDGPGRDWKFRRNERMLHTSRPRLIVAFPGGPGTRHMVQASRRNGYPVWDLRLNTGHSPLPNLQDH